MTDKVAFSREDAKRWITEIFNEKVKGRKPNLSKDKSSHDGKGGHWLEEHMGLKRNANNNPDIFNFEMKNNTTSKTTFGDWSPNYYIFRTKKNNLESSITRQEFFKIFGRPNPEKEGRCSWSGEPFPKFGAYNSHGQILIIDHFKNILALYSFSKDTRPEKESIVPKEFQDENILLAKWDAEKIKQKFERKFSQFGWFKCIQNENGIYEEIVFGQKMDFEFFLDQLKTKKIYLDCGMYDGNVRPYMSWRCSNTFWDTFPIDDIVQEADAG